MSQPRTILSPNAWIACGLALGFALVLVNAFLPQLNLRWLNEADAEAQRHRFLTDKAQSLLSALKDLETGQRGYTITGRTEYLEPYQAALDESPRTMRALQAALREPREYELYRELPSAVEAMISVHRRVVELRKAGMATAAAEVIIGGEGKRAFDRIRALTGELIRFQEQQTQELLAERASREKTLRALLAVLSVMDIAIFAAVFYFAFRQLRQRAAAQAALASTSARLEETVRSLERINRRSALLARAADALQMCATFEEAFDIVSKFGAQLMPDRPGRLYFLRASANALEPLAGWGERERPADAIEPADCLALRRGQPHLLADPAIEQVCPHLLADGGAVGPHYCVPLSARGEMIGFLSLYCAAAGVPLSDDDRRVVTAFGEQTSLTLANLRLREQLRRQSIVDSLTGLYNRRFLDESFKREMARAARRKQPLAVVLLDVDHFKQWNDSYGHEAGDHVLRLIGGVLQQGVRGSDVACRFGGEELVVVLPESSAEVARLRAETLRAQIEQIDVQYGGQVLRRVTASFGVAAFPEHGDTPESLLKAADVALYAAKRSGRNRVVVAEPAAPAASNPAG